MMDRATTVTAVIAASVVATGTAAADYVGQTYRHPPIRVTSTVNKLSELRDPTAQDRRMFLYELIEANGDPTGTRRGGIRWKVWSGTNATGSWTGWTDRREFDVWEEGQLGSSLAAVGGEYWNSTYGAFLPRFDALFDYRSWSGTIRVGRPWWNWLNSLYNWDFADTPSNGYGNVFQPFSGFTWKNGSTQRINVFGLTATFLANGDVNTMYLREQWWDGSTWRFTDHGRPSGGFYLRMGPNSAVWTDPRSSNSRGFTFMTEDDYQLFARYWNPGTQRWSWIPLGGPPAAEIRTPVAVSYRYGNATRVAVFVAARMYDRTWRLWGRYSDSGSSFSEWQDYGGPQLEANRELADGFDMTAGVVYRDRGGTLRINLFGTTDWIDRLSSGLPTHLGGHLVEFFWDGATWRWGMNMPPNTFTNGCETNVPGRYECPVRFQTMSASVVDHADWERIGVFGKDENDATWELGWNGATWRWAVH